MAQTSRALRHAATVIGLVLALYLVLAYLALPLLWTHREHQSGLADKPMVTRTGTGIPGDPLNIGLVGTREDVVRALHAAGWSPADPVTLKTGIAILGSVLLDRPYRDAPVSPLFYDGRREDMAFEMPVGQSARQRHHMRLWQVLDAGREGRPVFLGSASFDRGVGLCHYTGQVTHDIAPDLDRERAFVADSLTSAGMAETVYQITGVGPTLNGRNGEGSLYVTDGEIVMLDLVPGERRRDGPPRVLDAPAAVQAGQAAWRALADVVMPESASEPPR